MADPFLPLKPIVLPSAKEYNKNRLWLGAKGKKEKSMKREIRLKSILLYAAIVFLCSGYAMAGTWTTIDVPGATGTSVWGIDGRNIAGDYGDSLGMHGFVYDGTNWTTLDAPGAISTYVYGISGSNVVGTYIAGNKQYSFLYDGANWNVINMPGAVTTALSGIEGNNLVGSSWDSSGVSKGFLYDRTPGKESWTIIEKPGVVNGTYIWGIDGSNVVGQYNDEFGQHGFLYDGTNWVTLDAFGSDETTAIGIDGMNIVGLYEDVYRPHHDHGFLYDGTNWVALDAPGSIDTQAYDIDGANVGGFYRDAFGYDHGFIYEIPEPCTLLLFGLGAVIVRKNRS
jgi:hypothetical protein